MSVCTFNNTVVDIVNWCLSMRGKNTLLDTVSFQKTRYWTQCPFKKHVIGHSVLSKNTLLDTVSFQKTCYWTRCPFKKHVIGHDVLSKNTLLDTVSFQKTRYWTRCPFKKHVLDTVSFQKHVFPIPTFSLLHFISTSSLPFLYCIKSITVQFIMVLKNKRKA